MLRKITLLIMFMAAWLSSSAYDFMVNGLAYFKNVDGNSVSVTCTVWNSSSNYNGGSGKLVIPEKVTYGGKTYSVTNINEHAFFECSGFTGDLVIPSSVKTIGDYAFDKCSGLTSVTIPNSVTSIGDYAFDKCTKLKGTLNIPNSVKSIGAHAFAWCYGFSGDLVIPNSVTSIGEWAFWNCNGLNGKLVLSESLTEINTGTFADCPLSGELKIPNSVKRINGTERKKGAFYDCNFSGTLTLPNSITHIGYAAFEYCSLLSGTLVIPSTVTTVSESAFYGCSGFSNIKSLNPIPPSIFYNSQDSFMYNTFASNSYGRPLYVPRKSIEKYSSADVWEYFTNIIGLDELYSKEYNCFGGDDIDLAVNLWNNEKISGFTTELQLPEGYSFALDSNGKPNVKLSNRATSSHVISATLINDRCLRLTCNSSYNSLFNGYDGVLFTVKIRTSWDAPIGTEQIALNNIKLKDGNGKQSDIYDSNIDVSCYCVPGDANHDKNVTISDIIADARYILKQNPTPFHFKSANINDDSEVSISDIVITSNVIMGRTEVPDKKFSVQRLRGNDMLSANVVETHADGSRTVAIALDNATDYTAFQADLNLPEGMTVTGVRLSDRASRSHNITMNKIDDSTLRLLSYATDNAMFAGNSGNLILIDVIGAGDIDLINALFCEPNGGEHELDEITFGTNMSGINDITVGNSAPVNVYNAAGQLIRTNVNPELATEGLPAGLYIVGNKKVAVK